MLAGQRVNVYTNSTAAARTGRECKDLILVSMESFAEDGNRLAAIAEMAQTGQWFSQEKYFLANKHTAAHCDVRNMPSNWLCLSSLDQVSIGMENLMRLDSLGLDVINNYVLAGGFLAVNRVNSGLEVAKYLPIDLSRKYAGTKNRVVSSPLIGDDTQTAGETETLFFVVHGFGRVYLDNSLRSDYLNPLLEKSSQGTPVLSQLELALGNRTHRMSQGVGDDF